LSFRAVLFDAKGEDRDIDVDGDSSVKVDAHRLLWIDIDDRDPDSLNRAAAAIGLGASGLRRLGRDDTQARLLRLPDHVVLSLGVVEPDDPKAERHELDIVIGPNHVVTVHDRPLTLIDAFREEIHHEERIGELDAASFTAGLIDSVFTVFFRQIEWIEQEIDRLDEIAVRAPASQRFLDHVLALRRRIARVRRALAPNREALLPLVRPDVALTLELGETWPGIVQRLERAIDGVENARELLVGSFDLYLGRSSQRTNEVMKVLTLVSAIALPGIVLAGVMGMNFKLAFFDDPNNFFVVAAAMFVFAAAIIGIARWRGWF
jgi:magnesium transporter